MFKWATTQHAHIPIKDSRLRVKTVEVRDACYHDCSLEAGCLRDSPGCHETSVASTRDGNPIAIYQTTLHQVIDAIQEILEVIATHVTYYRVSKSYPSSPTAANIGPQYGITSRSQGLSPVTSKVIEPCPGRPTMDMDNHRGWSIALLRKGRRKQRVNTPAIYAMIADPLAWS